jgi:hypothetical protein
MGYIHLGPTALDAAIRLLEGPAELMRAGRDLRELETVGQNEKGSINPGKNLAVRQGFELRAEVKPEAH